MNGSFIVAMVFGVVVFGVVVGALDLIGGRFLPGFFMLGLVVLLMSLRFAPDTSARLLIGSIATVICSGAFVLRGSQRDHGKGC